MNIEDQKQFIIEAYDQGKSVLDIAEEIYGRDDKGQARYTDSMVLDIETMIKTASAEGVFCSPAVDTVEEHPAIDPQLQSQLEAQTKDIEAKQSEIEALQAQIQQLKAQATAQGGVGEPIPSINEGSKDKKAKK